MIMQGRNHGYEGLPPQQVTFPIRVMHELGIRTLIVTNAAGGINPTYRAGDLMLIIDHIGLAAMAGKNPLYGPNDDNLGPRFVNMLRAYDPALRQLALQVATELGIELHQGVYAGLAGPTFETPAEVRFLRVMGADAVGMSTVPEVMVARHMDMRVLGISGITNAAIADPDSEAQVDHQEVLEAGRAMAPRLLALLRGVLAGEDESTRRDVVLLNAAAALALEDGDFCRGLAAARQSLESGAALASLEALIVTSQSLAAMPAAVM
jgi:purine-nucleoside phosphorylase